MDSRTRNKVAAYLKLLHRHRGEAGGAYNEVAAVYDDFVGVWDEHIAACSLPEGMPGQVLKSVLSKATSKEGPLTHLLSERERPFHRCAFSLLEQFAGGLTTVATVGKCCIVTDEYVPCQAVEIEGMQREVFARNIRNDL